jgi:hypothetical protein
VTTVSLRSGVRARKIDVLLHRKEKKRKIRGMMAESFYDIAM